MKAAKSCGKVKKTDLGFGLKKPGHAEKQPTMSRYNAKLIKYSASTTRCARCSAEGAPEREFDRLGAVSNEFGIVFAHL